MYESVTVLNPNEHRHFRYVPCTDFLAFRSLTTIPIGYSEVSELCCDYPIVVLGGETPRLVVVTGIDPERGNLALTKEGKWRGDYVPAFLRRYPFTLVRVDENHLTLGVDLQSGCFSDPSGKALFDGEGKPMEWVTKEMEFLQNLEREMERTNALMKVWQEEGVLEEQILSYKLGGEEKKIGGFFAPNVEKIHTFEDEKVLQWARNGWLELVAFQQRSMRNFSKLVALAENGAD